MLSCCGLHPAASGAYPPYSVVALRRRLGGEGLGKMHRVCTMPPKRRFDRVGLPAEKRRRNGITTGLLHSVLAMAAAQFHSSYAAGPPNILIILADDLGYGDLGVTGHPTSRTPAIDQLAATGLRLTSFYTASPVCSPSRAGIATGRFPARSGVYCADNTYACGGPPHNGTSTDYRDCCNGVFLPGMPGGMSKTELTVAQLLQPRGCECKEFEFWCILADCLLPVADTGLRSLASS